MDIDVFSGICMLFERIIDFPFWREAKSSSTVPIYLAPSSFQASSPICEHVLHLDFQVAFVGVEVADDGGELVGGYGDVGEFTVADLLSCVMDGNCHIVSR